MHALLLLCLATPIAPALAWPVGLRAFRPACPVYIRAPACEHPLPIEIACGACPCPKATGAPSSPPAVEQPSSPVNVTALHAHHARAQPPVEQQAQSINMTFARPYVQHMQRNGKWSIG
ncbi:uncharacterized protein MAM_07333 [Metarhizium album ARSEF 1941]|uniref:Uncharacterized protein n=1 Tax=Metarhizium album (strain ARSEF 1941) TaxID=1081103 RepID=A0A0B2WMN8_METAS|nr:uncharacterized protein MAM_07333 [Metarhizium album ARSEF 1941]KHN94737.1 hypothetical protein MAM_07333 [Metarhizium album ARSEF 1941]